VHLVGFIIRNNCFNFLRLGERERERETSSARRNKERKKERKKKEREKYGQTEGY
jgi:hypothetical protein